MCIYIYTYISLSLLLSLSLIFFLISKQVSLYQKFRNLLLIQKLVCKLDQKTNRGLSQVTRNKTLKCKVKNLSWRDFVINVIHSVSVFSNKLLSKHIIAVWANLHNSSAAELYILEKKLQDMRHHGRINAAL